MSATASAASVTAERRISLSRGPALIVGTILLAAGLYFLYKQHTFPRLGSFPNGSPPVRSHVLFGIFGANGWTGMLTAIAGGLLLFGAAEHLLAKAVSLIVGVALAAAAIIALISGNVLGLAAANGWTEVAWGATALILLFNVPLPALHRPVTVPEAAVASGPDTDVAPAPVAAPPVAERPGRFGTRRPTTQPEPQAPRTESQAPQAEPVAVDPGEPAGALAGDDRTGS